MNRKLKKTLLLLFLFLVAFFINFYGGADIQHGEDFRHSVATLKFVQTLSPNALMAQTINGMEFLALPFYFIFGFELFSLKLAQSVFIGLAVVLFYLFSKNYLQDPKIALLTTLLLITFPYFILMKYQEYPFLAFFAAGLLYLYSLIFKKQKNEKNISFYGFLWGLGTYHKIMVAPFGFVLLFSHLVVYRRKVAEKLLKIKKLALLAISFAVGALPLIIWNTVSDYKMQTFEEIFGATSTMKADIISGLQERAIHIKEVFTTTPEHYFGEIVPIGFILLTVFIVSVIFLIFKRSKKGIVLILTLLIFILSSTLGLNVLIKKHLYMIVPLLATIIALGVFELSKEIFREKAKKVTVLVLGLLIALNCFNLQNILRTKNDYNFFTASFELQLSFRDKDFIENIYALHPDNLNSFWNSIYFTSGGKNVILASKVMEGENEILVGTYDGNDVGCKGGRPQEKSLEELLETSKSKNNIYVDVVHSHDDDEVIGKFRKQARTKLREALPQNGYLEISLYSPVSEKIYTTWVHGSHTKLIKDIKTIPKKEGSVTFYENSVYEN